MGSLGGDLESHTGKHLMLVEFESKEKFEKMHQRQNMLEFKQKVIRIWMVFYNQNFIT